MIPAYCTVVTTYIQTGALVCRRSGARSLDLSDPIQLNEYSTNANRRATRKQPQAAQEPENHSYCVTREHKPSHSSPAKGVTSGVRVCLIALETSTSAIAWDLAAKMGVDLKHSFEWTLFNTLSSLARTLQFTLAVTVCALYGVDLSNARQQGKYMDGKWVCIYKIRQWLTFKRLTIWL